MKKPKLAKNVSLFTVVLLVLAAVLAYFYFRREESESEFSRIEV